MLALLPLLLAAQPDVPREASSFENIGGVIATARVCDAFGYTIDRQGLADWAAMRRDALVARDASLTSDDAQLQIERHAVSSFTRDYRIYWEQATRAGRSADQSIEAEYRGWELTRVRLYTDGSRRVLLRRRKIRTGDATGNGSGAGDARGQVPDRLAPEQPSM